jgi:hypothetical protein
MKKLVLLLTILAMVTLLFAGCASQPKAEPTEQTDAVTTASIVNDGTAFVKAIGKDGTWIVATLNDLTVDQDLVVEGEFHDKGDATKDLYRKLALYAQDADRNVTARYKLTAPKMTVKSPNTKIQGGTFVGDVYVESNGFVVTDATIEGNVYFASQEYMDSSNLKEGTVTGEAALQK